MTRQPPPNVLSTTPAHNVEAGEPFAAGREADVFLLDDERVLRRYRTGADTAYEAGIMAYAAAHGYPVPAVYSASGPDMVMERLYGPTMAEAALAGQLSMEDAAVMLAELLRRLHELPPRGGADREGKSGWEDDGGQAGVVGREGSGRAGDGRAGDGRAGDGEDTIVHLDLHPENILITGRGPMVIDWRNAGDGPGDLDTALSALIIAQVAIGSIEHPLGAAVGAMLDRFLELAPGDPLRLLDEAAAYRRRQLTLSPDELAMIDTAAARVRAGVR